MQKATKTMSHGGSKHKGASCGGCSDHKLCKQYGSSFEVIEFWIVSAQEGKLEDVKRMVRSRVRLGNH